MATVQRIFDTLDTSTFLDGGSAANVDDTGTDSENIDLSQWEGCHCSVEVDFTASPTDDLVIDVLSSASLGGPYDSVPIFSFVVDNAEDPGTVSFFVTSVYAFKVHFKSSGSTDNINVTFRYRRWRWETV